MNLFLLFLCCLLAVAWGASFYESSCTPDELWAARQLIELSQRTPAPRPSVEAEEAAMQKRNIELYQVGGNRLRPPPNCEILANIRSATGCALENGKLNLHRHYIISPRGIKFRNPLFTADKDPRYYALSYLYGFLDPLLLANLSVGEKQSLTQWALLVAVFQRAFPGNVILGLNMSYLARIVPSLHRDVTQKSQTAAGLKQMIQIYQGMIAKVGQNFLNYYLNLALTLWKEAKNLPPCAALADLSTGESPKEDLRLLKEENLILYTVDMPKYPKRERQKSYFIGVSDCLVRNQQLFISSLFHVDQDGIHCLSDDLVNDPRYHALSILYGFYDIKQYEGWESLIEWGLIVAVFQKAFPSQSRMNRLISSICRLYSPDLQAFISSFTEINQTCSFGIGQLVRYALKLWTTDLGLPPCPLIMDFAKKGN